MSYSIKYFFLFILAVTVFLAVRHWLDLKREKIQDIDIVRADMDYGDAQLGTWAQKNNRALIKFRLKRDGSFLYEAAESLSKDTVKYVGKYLIMPAFMGNKGLPYPRLIAVSNKGDTVLNHFVRLTRATKKNVDLLSLKADNGPDAPAMLFYRIKQ